jgi:hypothetical protein
MQEIINLTNQVYQEIWNSKKNQKNNKITGNSPYLSILALNMNGFNSPIKSHRIVNWIFRKDPTILTQTDIDLE